MRLRHMIPGERDLPRDRRSARREHLVGEIREWEGTARRHRRRRALILVPAVLTALVATGFTTYALTREPTVFESVGCFDRASLSANVAVVANDGRDPGAICREVFAAGGLGVAAPDGLASCVLDTGAIGVFPSSGARTCQELGLADLPSTYVAQRKRFAALRNAIVAGLGEPASGSSRGGPQCVGEAEARELVRRALDAHGYGDWDVKVAEDGFSQETPCTDFAFDSVGKAVILIGNGPRS
jgi:hypothetical protein